MTKLEEITGLTYFDVVQMKKKLVDFVNSREFQCVQGSGRRIAYRRVLVHLDHILSGFRMEESGKYETLNSIYSK